MELITGILLGVGIAYGTLLVKEQVDARQAARWQKWYATTAGGNHSQPSRQPVAPIKANPQAETVVQPKQAPKPKPNPQQPQPQVDESDDELDRLMSMVDDGDE